MPKYKNYKNKRQMNDRMNDESDTEMRDNGAAKNFKPRYEQKNRIGNGEKKENRPYNNCKPYHRYNREYPTKSAENTQTEPVMTEVSESVEKASYVPPILDVPETMADMSKISVPEAEPVVFDAVPEENTEPEKTEQYEIIGVRFRDGGKTYYFDPDGKQFSQTDFAVVETARGIEFGSVCCANTVMPSTEIVLPLRKALRVATEEDIAHRAENLKKETEAFDICEKYIEKYNLPMKLVQVECTFDNSKLLFYFTSDMRVDFRELVKDLASTFRTRIELRQIGIRDEARMVGGLGICGRPFCCKSFLSDFVQVSIKMAKGQNLSLNSVKISGTCGRLMCCLRYEHEVYEEEIAKTPKVDSLVRTPDGDGVVTETSPLLGLVKVRLSASPDTPPKAYHRDSVKMMGYIKRDKVQKDKNAPTAKEGEEIPV